MRRWLEPLLVAGLALGMCAAAQAQAIGPTVSVTIAGVTTDLTPFLQITGTSVVLPQQTVFGPNGETVIVSSSGREDPFITFAFAAVNPLPTTDTFGFDETIPVVPTVPAGATLTNSLAGSITTSDTPTAHAVTISPTTGTTIEDATINGVSAGIPLGPAQTSGPGSAGVPTSFTYGPFSASTIVPVDVTSLDVHLLFDLTGNSDAASLTGGVSLTPAGTVPEPGSLAMILGVGFCGSLLAHKRLRRRA
jgi:hypothetical protein